MNTAQIITLVLTSSVISAGLTSWVNWLIQRNNYKNDFFKKLLDKRLSAYEQVESLIGILRPLIHYEQGRLCNLFLTHGKEHFDNFVISLAATSFNSIWLNEKISDKITEFNVFIIQEIDYQIDENKNVDEELIRLGIMNREKIKSFRLEFEKLLYNDLKNLHKLKPFLKNLKIDKQYSLFDKDEELKTKTCANSTN